MVVGVDDLSAIAGIISLSITFLHGCVKGFELLCRARKCETRMSSLRLMLEFEEQRLLRWAREAGLLTQPPNPLIAVQHVKLVHDTLKHLCILLNDVRNLKRYGFEEVTPSEVMMEMDDETALNRLDLVRRPGIEESLVVTRSIFQNRTDPWHKLRWVTYDEHHFRKLLSDIDHIITQLQNVLGDNGRQVLQRQHDLLLRTAVVSTMSPEDLEMLSQVTQAVFESPVAATARLKKRSLRLGFWERIRRSSSGSQEKSKLDVDHSKPVQQVQSDIAICDTIDDTKLRMSLLNLNSTPGPRACREYAYYNGKPVLLEWRAVTADDWSRLKQRFGNLASLLSAMGDSSFHSLSCHGYLRYESIGLYGYVFDLPSKLLETWRYDNIASPTTGHLPSLPKVQTLHQMLQIQDSIPSLNVRVSCAIVLLETILQLHTAGWLHKELRSENILMLGCMANPDPDEQPQGNNDVSSNMYVGGYVYARADDPQEFTEPARSEVESELYRHPASLGTIRRTYRKSFDIFSIGCIMLELGFWSSLSDILSVHVLVGRTRGSTTHPSGDISGPNQTNATPPRSLVRHSTGSDNFPTRSNSLDLIRLRQELLDQVRSKPNSSDSKSKSPPVPPIVEMLEAQTGRTYASVVVDCLKVDDVLQMCGASIGGQIDALEFEQKALERLRRLIDVL